MEYMVYYRLPLTADSRTELYKKAEKYGKNMSLCTGKTVYPHSFQEKMEGVMFNE